MMTTTTMLMMTMALYIVIDEGIDNNEDDCIVKR